MRPADGELVLTPREPLGEFVVEEWADADGIDWPEAVWFREPGGDYVAAPSARMMAHPAPTWARLIADIWARRHQAYIVRGDQPRHDTWGMARVREAGPRGRWELVICTEGIGASRWMSLDGTGMSYDDTQVTNTEGWRRMSLSALEARLGHDRYRSAPRRGEGNTTDVG